jgi:dipeptidyl-peptidase-4
MMVVDPTFDTRLKETYAEAMKRGLWKDKYASTNPAEYFAEGVQSWFDNNRPPDHDHNHVRTRKLLKEYDPGLAKLCEEVFGETQLVYTKPVTRLRDHLVGYDPSKSPKFVWPERLAKIGDQIRRDTVESRRKKNASQTASPKDEDGYELRQLEGWTLHIHPQLLKEEADLTEKAVKLLTAQLQEIVRVVPAPAVDQMRKVPLWFTPGYPGVRPGAEYHPDMGWLKENKRNVAMEKSVEFSDIRDFEAETKRMPNFALHELAHAYHDRVLGFDHAGIKEAYERAVKSGTYDSVERWLGPDRPKRVEKSYAMTNEKEYFAELTESLFSRNDFYPFVRAELERHDPAAVEVLKQVWGIPAGR